MRKYQPIWEKLKKTHITTLVAPISDHDSITRMVIKEKDIDLAFKQTCADKHTRYRLRAKTNLKKGTLVLTLVASSLTTIGNL